MLDINYIRENADKVKQAAKDKQFDGSIIDRVLEIDTRRRQLIQEVEGLRRQGNENISNLKGKPSDEQIVKGKDIKQKLQELEPRLTETEKEFLELMYQVPNPAAEDTPFGKDESGNVEVKKWGDLPQFNFPVLPHEELA